MIELMVINPTFFWFFLIFFFLLFEMGQPGLLYFLAFSCGAGAAFIVAWHEYAMTLQCTAFSVGTIIALFVIHFIVKRKKQELSTPLHRSNLEALIGKKIIVYRSAQDPLVWQAKIAGQIWTVRAIHDQILHEGQAMIIVDVQGCHLRVDALNKN